MSVRRAAWLGLALGLALLVLATPVGPWLMGRGLIRLAPHWGWQLHIGQTSGALAGKISFADLRASSPGDSLQFTLEQGSFSPWQYALTLQNPVLRLWLGTSDSTAADTAGLRLSVSSFPRLELTGGTFQLDQPADSLEILVEGLEAHYQATGDTTGTLQLNLARWRVARGGREQAAGALQAELQIEPARLGLARLETQVQSGLVQVRAQGQGSLGLGHTLPAALQLQTHLQTDSLRARFDLNLDGAFSPMDTRLILLGQLEILPLGPLALRARGRLDSARVAVDSLHLEAAGGLAEGRLSYDLAADSLALQLRLDHLDLSRLGQIKGQVDAQLQVHANLRMECYAGELDLWAHQLDALPGPPLDAQLQARLQPDHALSATLDSRLGQVQAAGTLAPGGQYDLDLTGTLNPSTLLGYAATSVQLRGRARPDSLQLRLDSPSLPLEDIHLGPVHAELTLVDGRQLESTLSLAGTQLRAQLRADLQQSRRYTFTAELAALPLAQLDSSLAGTLQGQLRASGGLDPASLRLDGRLQLQGAAYRGWQSDGDLGLDLEYTARHAQFLLSGQGLRAAGTFKAGDHLEGQLELDQARFHRADTDSLVLSGSLQMAGRASQPAKIAASGLLSRLVLRQGGWEIRAADTLKFAYTDQQLRCERFALQTPAGLLHLEGSAGQDHLEVQGHIAALDLGNWSPAVTGTGELSFALGGTAARPQLQAQARLDQLRLNGQPLGAVQAHLGLADTLAFSADLEQDGDQEREFSLELAAPAAPLFAADTTGAQLRLRLHARQADLRAPLSLLMADSVGGQLSLDGDLRLPLSLLGDPGHWNHLAGQVRFDQLQFDKPGLHLHLPDQAPATIALDDDHLEVKGLALLLEHFDPAKNQLLADGTLSLKGTFSPSVHSQLQLDLAGIDLRTLDTWNQQESYMPVGEARLQARFAGTLADPNLEAGLEIATEELGEIEGHFRGDAREGDLKLEWLALSGDSLALNARLPWDLKEGLVHWERGQLQAHSSGFSLLPLLDQLPQLERLDGTLSMDLAVDGFTDNLQVSGWAQVEDLELRILDVKPSYFFPVGRLEFAGRRGELRDFAGYPLKGEGRAELSGYVELAALDSLAYDLRLQAENLPFNYDDIFVAPGIDLVDGSFSSTPTGSLLRCQVRIDKAQAEVPLIDLNAPPVPPPPATVRDPFLENMQLDVAIDLRDLQVENEVSQLRVEGIPRISGTFYKPQFQGSLEIPEGKVFVLNSEFAFQKGRISLDRPVPWSILDLVYDPLLLNPDLDIEVGTTVHLSGNDAAELGAEDCKVTIKLQGPTQGKGWVPVFTSEPAMPEQDLLRLLAFGAVQQSQSEKDVFYTAAGQLLLSRQVKRIGLDQFQILPSGTLLKTVGKSSVRLGNYFKFPLPLQVNYEAATANPSEGEFRVEYKMGAYMTLTGAAQSKYQRYGLGIGLKKDFR